MLSFETLNTKKMLLKGLTPSDMKYVFENYEKPEIMEILGLKRDEDFEKEEVKFKNGYASYNQRFILFLMTDKSSNCIIGRCGFHNWNISHNRAEIGYVIENENYRNKGLMREAVTAILDYGFNKLMLNRIEALVGPNNTPSLKLMAKFNFTKEGILRKHYKVLDKFEDSVMFALLREEYLQEKGS